MYTLEAKVLETNVEDLGLILVAYISSFFYPNFQVTVGMTTVFRATHVSCLSVVW